MFLSISADGFFPTSNIKMIGTRTRTSQRLWKIWDSPSQDSMLRDFLSYFLKFDDKTLIGFDILKFDIPLLLLKTRDFPNFSLLFKRLTESKIIDIAVILNSREEGMKPLNELMRKYSISGVAATDRDLLRLYQTHEYAQAEEQFTERMQKIIDLYDSALGNLLLGNK